MKAEQSKQLFDNRWQMSRVLERFDIFGEPLPSFNIKGKQQIQTRIGGVCTVLILATTLLFSVVKFIHLWTRNNPNLSQWHVDVSD